MYYTSTSSGNVVIHVTSTSGAETILVTGAGTNAVTAQSGVGSINVISVTGAGVHTIVANLGNYTITGGAGVDTITGGSGTDTFVFGTNGSIIGTALDVITDFKAINFMTFGATTNLIAADILPLVAGSGPGSNVQTTAGGLITFAPADNTFALKVAALQASTQLHASGTVAMFIDSGNTYVYYAGVTAGNANEQLVQLSGVTNFTTITSGATTHLT